MDNEKLMKVAAVAVLFFVVSAPCTYGVVNSLTGLVLDKKGCPTYAGVLVHTLVFALLLYVLCTVLKEEDFSNCRNHSS